eukprot:2152582-Prymnesium_polylepis.1
MQLPPADSSFCATMSQFHPWLDTATGVPITDLHHDVNFVWRPCARPRVLEEALAPHRRDVGPASRRAAGGALIRDAAWVACTLDRAGVKRIAAEQSVRMGVENNSRERVGVHRNVAVGLGLHILVDQRRRDAVARVPLALARDPRLPVRVRVVHCVKLCGASARGHQA